VHNSIAIYFAAVKTVEVPEILETPQHHNTHNTTTGNAQQHNNTTTQFTEFQQTLSILLQ
jgi:hypothetical protein